MRRIQDIKKRWSTDQLITGVELPQWIKILQQNEFKVGPEYFHRAAWISGFSLGASLAGRYEDAVYGKDLAAMDVDPAPLFILGHWRSGTTHLHNLLGRVPQHTYSTVFQCVFPTSFLTLDGIVPQLTERFMDDTRSYDNVKHGWYEAAEDEIALAKLTGLSPYISFMFPDNQASYEKYIDFIEATEAERKLWKREFNWFIKKIMLQTGGKRVVVKSCTHTARVRMLLEMYPNARFIYIHRNPYEVFSSTLHMRSHTDWENFFHLPFENWEQERERVTLTLGQRIFERFIADRHLIPEENYYELAYTDLCGNEMEVVGDIWSKLRLGGWESSEPVLQQYVDSLKGYKRNKLQFDDRMKDMVYDQWREVFDTFGYDREYPA